jgi:hypothetical protein
VATAKVNERRERMTAGGTTGEVEEDPGRDDSDVLRPECLGDRATETIVALSCPHPAVILSRRSLLFSPVAGASIAA